MKAFFFATLLLLGFSVYSSEIDQNLMDSKTTSSGFASFVIPTLPYAETALALAEKPGFRFDFTFGWTTDAQNIVLRNPHLHIENIRWLADNRDALNLVYVFNTGDITTGDTDRVWLDSHTAQAHLDRAQIPNGVIPGNHDWANNFANYRKWFGADRFRTGYWATNNEWYRDSWDDNIGHYAIISAGGVDFVMVHMGTLPHTNDGEATEDDLIELKARGRWINDIFRRYPNHAGILAMHQYLASGLNSGAAYRDGRLWVGHWYWENVVIPNQNVFMVLAGHALGTWNRVIAGSNCLLENDVSQATVRQTDDRLGNRVVHEILFNYQGNEEPGGNGDPRRYRQDMWGMIRLMHFDMEASKIHVRTYSPINNSIVIFDRIDEPQVPRIRDNFVIDFGSVPR